MDLEKCRKVPDINSLQQIAVSWADMVQTDLECVFPLCSFIVLQTVLGCRIFSECFCLKILHMSIWSHRNEMFSTSDEKYLLAECVCVHSYVCMCDYVCDCVRSLSERGREGLRGNVLQWFMTVAWSVASLKTLKTVCVWSWSGCIREELIEIV